MIEQNSQYKSSKRPHTFAKENLVWIRGPYPDTDSGHELLPKFKSDFLVQGYICVSDHSLRRYKPNCGKMPYLVKLPTNRQTNKQTPGINNLLDGDSRSRQNKPYSKFGITQDGESSIPSYHSWHQNVYREIEHAILRNISSVICIQASQ